MRTDISCMRVAAAFAVVLIHVSASALTPDSGVCLPGQIFNCLGRWAVPLFVMISGALLLQGSRRESISHFYSKRVLKLVPLLLLWNAVYFRFRYWGAHLSAAQMVDIAAYKGGFYYHLWYLQMALGLYLVTPFLRTFLDRFPRQVLLSLLTMFFLAVFVYLLALGNPFDRTPAVALSIPFLGYYILGHYLDSIRPGKRTGWICVALFLLAFACTVGANCLLQEHSPFTHPFSPTVFVMSVSIFLIVHGWRCGKGAGDGRWMHYLAGTTLGIYLVHPLVIHTIHRVSIFETRLPWLSIPLMTIAVFLFSLLACLAWARAKSRARRVWIAWWEEGLATSPDRA